MTEVHHFAYGWFSPALALGLAFLGSVLGLGCLVRARAAATNRRRGRWLALAAVSISGAGVWLMQFMAMLGFDVPDTPVRFHPGLIALSLVVGVAMIGIGLIPAGLARSSLPGLLAAGLLTGCGVLAMHYTGLAALRVAGRISYDLTLVAVSAGLAVVGVTVALWIAAPARRGRVVAAALILAATTWGMHYTGVAAMRVELREAIGDVAGISPLTMIVPITLLTGGALLATSLMALPAMTEEELQAPSWRQLTSGARG